MISFEQLGLKPEIIKAIREIGFEQPMPVQEKVIPLLLDKMTDIVALAQTGTGKTAAFGLPIIQRINTQTIQTQALILAPTRELCLQITDDLLQFSKYIDDLHVVPVYGGANIETQIRALKAGAQVIVATPGRLIDLIHRKAARLNKVTMVVLDEADEMLNMGFTADINTILSQIPEQRNMLMFSATMPAEIASIAQKYMKNPVEVTIGRKNTGAESVQHIYYTVHAKDKYFLLKRIIDVNPDIYAIIFCRTRKETQEIADKLMHDGYNADALHGDLSQAQRDFVMNRFRLRQLNLLVATDVAARGLDVDELTHVINYNLPDDIEVYTHRSGRTGRAGRSGISIAIINLREKHFIRSIEKMINKKFIAGKIPTNREICEKQLFNLIDKVERVEVDNTEIEPYLSLIYRKLEWLDKEEIIKRFVSLEFNRFLEYYKNARELEIPFDESVSHKREKLDSKSKSNKYAEAKANSKNGFCRLFINIGRSDGLYPNTLIDLVNQYNEGRRVKIGKIELLNNFSFFEVPVEEAPEVIQSFKKATFEGKRIAVDFANDRKK